MTENMKCVVDGVTGEQTMEPMTEEELALDEQTRIASLAEIAAEQVRAEQKAVLLEKLGITAEEAALLIK